MIIFIGNLPAAMTLRDLCGLARLPTGLHARIHKTHDGKQGLHRYGLIHAQSERDGYKIIKRMHGLTHQGCILEAREFGHRLVSNERRRLDWRAIPWPHLERRTNDRRALYPA